MGRGATSQAALRRKAAGLDPPASLKRHIQGKRANAKDPDRAGVPTVAGGTVKGLKSVQSFAIISLGEQRAKAQQAVSFAMRNAPSMVKVLVDIAMGVEPGRPSDRIAAASKVLDLAQVAVPQKESTKTDAPMTELAMSELRALVAALESIKSQAVTVDGDAERLDGHQRHSDVTDVDTEPG